MRYVDWTDREWNRLVELCRADGVPLKRAGIRRAARAYMEHGADGGGNVHGLAGTVVALNVDKVNGEAAR